MPPRQPRSEVQLRPGGNSLETAVELPLEIRHQDSIGTAADPRDVYFITPDNDGRVFVDIVPRPDFVGDYSRIFGELHLRVLDAADNRVLATETYDSGPGGAIPVGGLGTNFTVQRGMRYLIELSTDLDLEIPYRLDTTFNDSFVSRSVSKPALVEGEVVFETVGFGRRGHDSFAVDRVDEFRFLTRIDNDVEVSVVIDEVSEALRATILPAVGDTPILQQEIAPGGPTELRFDGTADTLYRVRIEPAESGNASGYSLSWSQERGLFVPPTRNITTLAADFEYSGQIGNDFGTGFRYFRLEVQPGDPRTVHIESTYGSPTNLTINSLMQYTLRNARGDVLEFGSLAKPATQPLPSSVLLELPEDAGSVFWLSVNTLTTRSDFTLRRTAPVTDDTPPAGDDPIPQDPVDDPTPISPGKPPAPTIDPVTGDDMINAVERAAGVEVTGRGDPGTVVTVRWAQSTRQVEVGENGIWEVRFEQAAIPPDGPSSITAIQRDGNGEDSAEASRSVVVDTVPPDAPSIETFNGGTSWAVTPDINDQGTVTVQGTTDPNTTVTVTWGDAERSTFSGSGNWQVSLPVPDPSATQSRTLRATASDRAGNESGLDFRSITFDFSAPRVTSIDTIGNGDVVALGPWTPPEPSNMFDRADPVTISGTARDASGVAVTWGGVTKSAPVTTGPDGQGQWSVTFTHSDLPSDGTTQVSVVARSAANTSPPLTRDVVVDLTRPDPPTITSVNWVEPDGWLQGHRFVLTAADESDGLVIRGRSEGNATITATRGNQTQTDQANGSGFWTIRFPVEDWEEGRSSILFSVVDEAGNEMAGRPVVLPILVALDVPPVPEIDPVSDTGILNADMLSAGVEVTGRFHVGESASPVIAANIRVAGRSWSVSVDAEGAFSALLTSSMFFDEGDYQVRVTGEDIFGNTGPESTLDIIVDRAAPPPLDTEDVLADPLLPASIREEGLVLSGAGEPGGRVALNWEDVEIEAPIDADGLWRIALAADDIPEADQGEITLTPISPSGNRGESSVLAVRVLPPPRADDRDAGTPLPVDAAVEGFIRPADNPEDWFRFTPERDKTVTVSLDGLEADLDLQVRKADGTLVGVSDRAGKESEEVTFAAQAAQDYDILVTGFMGVASPYELSLTRFSGEDMPASPAFLIGEPIDRPLVSSWENRNGQVMRFKSDRDDTVTVEFFDLADPVALYYMPRGVGSEFLVHNRGASRLTATIDVKEGQEHVLSLRAPQGISLEGSSFTMRSWYGDDVPPPDRDFSVISGDTSARVLFTGPAGLNVTVAPDQTMASGVLEVSTGTPENAAFQPVDHGALQGALGVFDFNPATGEWSYRADPARDGWEIRGFTYERLQVFSLDGTATEIIVVEVHRSGVRPSGPPPRGSEAFDATVIAGDAQESPPSWQIELRDPEGALLSFRPPDPDALQGEFGTFAFDFRTATWTYTLDHDRASVRALPEGAEVTDSLTVTSLDGTVSETLNVTVIGAGLSDGMPVVPEGSVMLLGEVIDRAGDALPGTGVTFTSESGEDATVETGNTGRFAFELPAGSAGHLDAARDHGTGDPSISTASALETLRMAVGLNPSWGPAGPMDFIAADFDGDGRVTTADALAILRVAVGLTAEAAPRWVFVDPAADLSGVDGSNTGIETGLFLDPLAAHTTELSLTGVLLGSVQQYA